MLDDRDARSLIEQEIYTNVLLRIQFILGEHALGFSASEERGQSHILNIGCGLGTWTLDVARRYPEVQIVGIDDQHATIRAANRDAKAMRLSNVLHYYVQQLSVPFPFPDASFDLITMHFLSRMLRYSSWPYLLQECRRLLRPGGKLYLLDFEAGISNAPAHEAVWKLFLQAMRLCGQSCSSEDRYLGLLCEIESLFVHAGFEDVALKSYLLNYSSGVPLHEEWLREFRLIAAYLQPSLVRMGLVTQHQSGKLLAQQKQELEKPDFHAVLPLFSVWGTKQEVSRGNDVREAIAIYNM